MLNGRLTTIDRQPPVVQDCWGQKGGGKAAPKRNRDVTWQGQLAKRGQGVWGGHILFRASWENDRLLVMLMCDSMQKKITLLHKMLDQTY